MPRHCICLQNQVASSPRARTVPGPLVWLAALVLGAAASHVSAQASATVTGNDGTLLSISAQAEARRVPDIARLSVGVVNQDADANAAMRANAERMTRVTAAIAEAGIAQRDVQTSGVNLNPQYRYADNQQPVIIGYQASNTVSVTLRDLTKLGRIMDVLVAIGANQVNGPSFDVDDKEPVYDEARRTAIGMAKARAQMYAKTLGMQVRRIVSISEGGGFSPPMPMPMMARMEKATMDTPISPGESSFSVNLDVVFELGPATGR